MFFGSSSLAFFQKRSSAQGCSVVLPHCADSFECKRVLGIQLEHVKVGQLGFVVVARFKIIVRLAKKARFPGFLGAGGDERDCQNKRQDFE